MNDYTHNVPEFGFDPGQKSDSDRRIEYFNLARELEKHHDIFYTIWNHGTPEFTDTIPTACMEFDRTSLKPIRFKFNPEFWDSMDQYKRAFVVSHEALHAFLNHGIRSKFDQEELPAMLINQAMDVAINHLLVNNFGYERALISDSEAYCWVDTIFGENSGIDDNLSYEEYRDLMADRFIDGNMSLPTIILVDEHGQFVGVNGEPIDSDDLKEILNQVVENSDASKAKEFEKIASGVGNTEGNFVLDHFIARVVPLKTWEKIIKTWKRTGLSDEAEADQWIIPSRRYTELPDDFCLPNEDQIFDPNFAPNKLNIALFMDISGSCFSYAEHFTLAVRSIPKKRFKKRVFTFDTSVREIPDIDKWKPRSGGGTSFECIHKEIVRLSQEGYTPDLVFIITDGQSYHANYTNPGSWHWFIMNFSGNKSWVDSIPEQCHVHDLDKFFVYKNSYVQDA